MAALEKALAQAWQDQHQKSKKQAKPQGPGTRIFVVVEAIFQRTGAMIPLAEVVSLKEQYGAHLILDETLSFGTLGATGRGLTEHLSIETDRIDALIGSFEHAIAGVGGFCSGRKTIVEHQRLAGAGYCFSACCPPSACAGIMAMLNDLTRDGGQTRRASLQRNSALLHSKLHQIVADIRAPVRLMGTGSSYVQHLRWTGAVDEGISCFTKVLQSCLENSGVQVQLCAPQLSATETALNVRIGARAPLRPSIRLCTSSEQTETDIIKACAAIGAALAEA
jgi:serine palmitoyltransferase